MVHWQGGKVLAMFLVFEKPRPNVSESSGSPLLHRVLTYETHPLYKYGVGVCVPLSLTRPLLKVGWVNLRDPGPAEASFVWWGVAGAAWQKAAGNSESPVLLILLVLLAMTY